jgi:putative redox protein
MDTLSVRWNGNRQYVSWDEGGHTVVMDSRPEYRGEGAGMRPLQVFLAGLAGCTAMDVISVLEKKRQDVRDLEVAVEADQRDDDFPKIYTAIRLHFTVAGFGVSAEAVRRAIELSEDKYCSVKGMLGPQVTVSTSFEIVEANAAGTPAGR